MPDTRTDNDLMRDFYDCNEEAFAKLVRRWEGLLFGYLLKRLFSRELAEDLVQETFVKIYVTKESNVGRYELDRPFGPWIYRFAHNLAEDARRKRNRRLATQSLLEDVASKPPPSLGAVLDADLSDCLERLSERERTFLLLWEDAYGESSQTEVAKVLDVSDPTVCRIRESALRKLRECLTEKGYKPREKPSPLGGADDGGGIKS